VTDAVKTPNNDTAVLEGGDVCDLGKSREVAVHIRGVPPPSKSFCPCLKRDGCHKMETRQEMLWVRDVSGSG
jgi:hypothetical protein